MNTHIVMWVTILLPLLIAVVTSARVSFQCREWPWVLALAPLSGMIACGITSVIALKIGSFLVFLIEGSGQGPSPVGVSGDNLFTFALIAGVQTTLGTLLALIVALIVLTARWANARRIASPSPKTLGDGTGGDSSICTARPR
jgi:hypothetical protein